MNLKPLLFIPPIVLAFLGFSWMTSPEEQTSSTPQEARQAVRALTVQSEALSLTATGFGRVEPVHSWSAVSQAEGRVIGLNPDLAIGTVVAQGTVLVQIDPTDYELAIAKSEANIASAEATLAELDRQEANSKRLLEIEQRIFVVVKAEFDRVQTLSTNGTVTAASLDAAQKSLLAQENSVINLTNAIELYPAQRASAEATLAVRRSELATAQRGLDNTTIVAPFRGRVSAKAVENSQFVRTGEDLMTLDAIDEAEVVGAFQPSDIGALLRAAVGPQLQDVTQVDATLVVDYMQRAGIMAYVVLDFAGTQARYPATVARFRGSIDNETGNVGIAVRVADPLLASTQQDRPPLELGSFVSVVLETAPIGEAIAIPRAVLQQDDEGAAFVFTADGDDRLAMTSVTAGPVVGDQIMIVSGLSDGARVVLSTPRPAIAGMALTIISADEAGQ